MQNEAHEKVTIRAAVKSDSRMIASLYQISSDGVSDYIWSKLAGPGEELLDVGERRYQREGFVFSYENCSVATFEGQVIGMLVAFPMIIDPDYIEEDPVLVPYSKLEEGQSFYICGVAVLPQYRGQGIGKRFMLLAEEKAKSLSLNKLSLIVFEQNTPAIRLYERLAYREVTREKVVAHPMIHYSGYALLMVKQL
jgi:ribosomal protein S18 acetylase RimI-like enzyme